MVNSSAKRASRRAVSSAGLVALGLVLLATGCGTVEPWRRGAFARPRMEPDPHAPESVFVDHVRQSREAGPATVGTSGAGCGCY